MIRVLKKIAVGSLMVTGGYCLLVANFYEPIKTNVPLRLLLSALGLGLAWAGTTMFGGEE